MAGPPALDELVPAVEGSAGGGGDVVAVKLALEPALAAVWSAHRKNFDDDSSALRAALNL